MIVATRTLFLYLLCQQTNESTLQVITIAHRLHTIIDSNVILVMDGGRQVNLTQMHQLFCYQEDMLFFIPHLAVLHQQ
jgi:ABC-type transport system involved in Fe-S cluster assembly fused permease/ATPase subunit